MIVFQEEDWAHDSYAGDSYSYYELGQRLEDNYIEALDSGNFDQKVQVLCLEFLSSKRNKINRIST